MQVDKDLIIKDSKDQHSMSYVRSECMKFEPSRLQESRPPQAPLGPKSHQILNI
jgi:hypothetical protein